MNLIDKLMVSPSIFSIAYAAMNHPDGRGYWQNCFSIAYAAMNSP